MLKEILGKKYVMRTFTLKELKQEIQLKFINTLDNDGFCRQPNKRKIKRIKEQLLGGTFTPSVLTAFCEDYQEVDRHIELKSKLKLIDGVQRYAALTQIYNDAVEKNKKNLISQIELINIPVLVLLGKVVYCEVITNLNCSDKVSAQIKDKFSGEISLSVAEQLNSRSDSPLRLKIKIDASGPGTISYKKMKKLPSYEKLVRSSQSVESIVGHIIKNYDGQIESTLDKALVDATSS